MQTLGTHGKTVDGFLRHMGQKALKPDLNGLLALSRSFSVFPYENFTKIIRAHEFGDPQKRLRLPDTIFEEHKKFGAGGTCFSLTNFFSEVLIHTDFEMYPVLCDRSYGPATHSAVIVKTGGGKYLLDPGYLMDEPIRLPKTGEARSASKAFITRLVRLGSTNQYLLFTQRDGKTKLRYRFKDEKVSREDFVARWVDSFDWAFMRHACASRMTPDGQIYLRDDRIRMIRTDALKQEKLDGNMEETIKRNFGIDPKIVEAAMDCKKGTFPGL